MSKVERKEYQETKIMRTMSPMRGVRGDSGQFDNNLDNLLEDLQSSVPANRGKTYRETRVVNHVDSGRSNSLNRVTHLQASNPVVEYASDDAYNYTAPDGSNKVRSYKKEVYSYSTAGNGVPPEKHRMQNNINQLDTLLDDLKHVKQSSSINNAGVDPGLVEYNKSKVMMGKKVVERELHYGDTPPRGRTLERGDREGSMTREIEYVDEGTYGETRPIRYTTPSPSRNQTSTLTKQKVVTNVQAHPLEVVETTTPVINPEILASLDPNLLPSGNTKVTTTIKTYTYEIPGTGYKAVSPEPEKYVYSPNDSQTTPSKSFVYNKIENKDVHYTPPQEENWKTGVYRETTTSQSPPYQRPTSPRPSGTTIIKETTRNYQPGYHPDPSPNKQTYIYNETTTTRHVNDGYPDDPYNHPREPVNREPMHREPINREPIHREPINREPPRNETYIYRETQNTTNRSPTGSYPNGYPPHEPVPTTIIYKHDERVTNYPPRHQHVPPPNTTVIINKTEYDNDPNRYPPHDRRPHEPYDPNNVNITYKYTTHSSASNNYKGYPPNDESRPLLRPQPFPHDGPDGPPKRVDELMANIGREPPDSPLNAGYIAHEAELIQQKKVESLKQQHQAPIDEVQRKERNVPATKNITGPPVYYPPGEMFLKKEEGGGAWRAEGAMARESGRYKYEAESSSKSKAMGGAAVVPVCLPLCCGLPCTIL
ncbi:hypothetical protein RN001_014809 [Aquatica leii]|uniref:Uncharacterized protein n=1 Tax=Aquatica leii TaxID=1421715 RepID=A0AAN7PYU3_9COLE|nr:hypothetical protein RN001_014809 [Aquatica leii]